VDHVFLLKAGVNTDYSELVFYNIHSSEMVSAGLPPVVALRVNKYDSIFMVIDNNGILKLSKLLTGVSINKDNITLCC
jgi:hypothetical protein